MFLKDRFSHHSWCGQPVTLEVMLKLCVILHHISNGSFTKQNGGATFSRLDLGKKKKRKTYSVFISVISISLQVTEQIKVEQTARDQNVAEYLKLVNNADKQQVGRIRQVFEKKNQKSAQSIARLQRKLEQYHRRMKDSETNGKHSHKDGSGKESGTHSKEGSLKDISTTGRHPALDKVKTIGPGVSLSPPFFFNKSREFANLIRNKFGSADNIAHLKSSMEAGSGLQVEGGARGLSGSATTVAKASKYQSDDECSTGTSASADSNGNAAGGSGAGSGGPARSDSNGRIGEVLDMVREIREAQQQLADDMETLNTQFKRDYSYFTQMMQEERYRWVRHRTLPQRTHGPAIEKFKRHSIKLEATLITWMFQALPSSVCEDRESLKCTLSYILSDLNQETHTDQNIITFNPQTPSVCTLCTSL